MKKGTPEPVRVLVKKGKKHLTKAEIKYRAQAEDAAQFGSKKMTAPADVAGDPVALSKWKELILLYKDQSIVTSADTGIIAEYCIAYAEYQKLLSQKPILDSIDINAEEEIQVGELVGGDMSKIRVRHLLDKMNYLVSLDGYLKIDSAINKKRDQLMRLSDRLFLNPLSKVKAVMSARINKHEKKQKETTFEKEFGDV